MLEHTYPRYTNACLQPDQGMYLNNVMNTHAHGHTHAHAHSHADADMGGYGQVLGGGMPAPGPSCGGVGGGGGGGAGGGGVGDAQGVGQGVGGAAGVGGSAMQQKRRRTTNPQAEENFQRALEAVRFGGIGFCKAARMFGVNNRTLWLEYKKKGYPNNRPSIKSRIKREHVTPPPKEEAPAQDAQLALLCPPHAVPVPFLDARPVEFNIINGVNFPLQ